MVILNKIKKTWFYGWWLFRFMVKMSLAIVASVFVKMSGKYDDLWLIMELPKEARDNGYWLFKYIIENHPEINVKFVLAEDSPDYKKMPAKNKIIKPYSWEHYISYVLCTRSISSHVYGASPGRYYAKIFLPFIPKKEEVFLQHGVTKEPIPLRGFSGWTMAVSPTEINYFIGSGHKSPDMILMEGFCRFDGLVDISRRRKNKIILIMPTFRNWLGGNTPVDDDTFLESEFYKTWQSLLKNEDLNNLVREYSYRVVFYLHRQMQDFANLFDVGESFEVATKDDYDVQYLLRVAVLLITDYSSVFYDFSYMKKPVIFYQFDHDNFYSRQHKYSGGPYPFGKYADSEKEVVGMAKKYARSGFRISKSTEKEIDGFFVYTDKKNSERNFNVIKELPHVK